MLSKENIEEQVVDNQSRLIRMQEEDTLLSSNQQILKLPEGFTIGKAIGGGDCFFDAVAQGLKQLKPEMNFTTGSLREVCWKQAFNNQEEMKNKVIKDARYCVPDKDKPHSGISNDELWEAYLLRIVHTAQDMKEIKSKKPGLYEKLTDLKYGITLEVPVWGRPEIEGRMICNEYNVKFHVVENLTYLGWSGYLVDGLASKNVDTDYNGKDIIHIINGGLNHFDPVLRKKVQQILPHSNLTQGKPSYVDISWTRESKKMANDVPLISKIHREFISVIEDSDLTEHTKLKKLKDFFRVYKRLDVNFRVNQHGDTPLHVAVYSGELLIIKFLLKVGACTDIQNRAGKTSMDIAEDNDREDIVQILQPFVFYKEVYVPGDGNCLFWSVALAYLTPVKFDDYTFNKRFKRLFGKTCDVEIQRLMQDNATVYKNDKLRKLATEEFRSKVINEMYHSKEELKNKINMEDFLEFHNEGYFIEGIFKKKFENMFSAKKIKKYAIDTSKLQPNFFDENAVKELCTELDKIQKYDKVQEFIFEAYLECMETPKSWGGIYEINAMSKMLGSAIIVSQKGLEDHTYNKEKKYYNKIYLSYKKGCHYTFYQVKYSTFMEFVLSFVQLFETKLIIYDVLGCTLREEKRIFPQEINVNGLVRSIFGISAHTGGRTVSNVRASLKIGNVTKATKNFISLSDLIETFKRYKLGFRKILVDAGCNIFQSFEMQFDEIGFNHISKVVNDLIDKVIEYYIQKEYEEKLDYVEIAEALVFGKYLQEIPDKIVQYGKKNYNFRDLYENIGIAKKERDSFIYYRRNNKDSCHGYRRFLIGEKLGPTYVKVETTNVKFENYTYTLDLQDFKHTKEQAFCIVNKEIQVLSTKIIEDLIVKIKPQIEREISFLGSYIIPYRKERKQSIIVHMNSFKKTGNLSESEKATDSRFRMYRAKENSRIMSLMEENLKKIPNSCYCQKVKEAFVKRAEVISQERSNLSELQYFDTAKPRNPWPHIKALAFLLKKMDFKDVCAPVEEFTGRQEQIEEVYKKLQEGAVVIIGPPGVGKTQLARKYVEKNKEAYFHVCEADIESMLSIESSFTSFIRDKLAMCMEEEEGKQNKKCLFLFKGAKKEDVNKVLKIMNKTGGFDSLFTSSDYGYQDIAEVALDTLKEKQAKQLVKKILKIVDTSQNEQIEEFVSTLKGFPLAIKQAATCIKNRNFRICEYLLQYKNYNQVLPQSTGQNEYDRVLQITSFISMKAIEEVDFRKETLEILSAMTYFGTGQIDSDLFLICNRDENELYSIFELLEHYSMIHVEEKDGYKLYVMHELIKKAIRLQFNIDKEKQVLSYTIRLVCEAGESFYPYVGHFLSLFYNSRGYGDLMKENCNLVYTILSALNTLCEYKKALSFGFEAFRIFIAANKETVAMINYEIACTKVALGEYNSALKVFLNLKKEETSKGIFFPLSLDKAIVSIYFKQKRYEKALSYLRSDDFLLIELLDGRSWYYVDNYLSIIDTVAKIFVMQERYTDAFTILYYERELRNEIFLKKSNIYFCNSSCFCSSEIYGFYNLEAKYTYALTCLLMSQSREKITIKEEILPHKKKLPRELNILALFNQLQDILKNQESSQYLQSASYSIERNIGSTLQRKIREKILQRFEAVIQLQKDYGFSENHPKVLSVKFYIAILYSCLGEREKALQKLQQLQELREKVIGVNHPDTLITVDAVQELFTRGEDRLAYLKNEIEKRESFLQFERSDLNVQGISTLKEIYAKKNGNYYPSTNALLSRKLLPGGKRGFVDIENIQAKRRKIDNQQQVNSCLSNVNIGLNHQQEML